MNLVTSYNITMKYSDKALPDCRGGNTGVYYCIFEPENMLICLDTGLYNRGAGVLSIYSYKKDEIELFSSFNLQKGCEYISYYKGAEKLRTIFDFDSLIKTVFFISRTRGFSIGFRNGEFVILYYNRKGYNSPINKIKVFVHDIKNYVVMLNKKQCFCYKRARSFKKKNKKAFFYEFIMDKNTLNRLWTLGKDYQILFWDDLFDETVAEPGNYKYLEIGTVEMEILLPFLLEVNSGSYGELKRIK